jgi:hypothetical protein
MWKTIFETYWNQILIILAMAGYFGKRAFDLKSKKVEISYTVFQQKKLEALEYFVTQYNTIDFKILDVQLKPVIESKLTYREFDNRYFFEYITKLLTIVKSLNIYCSSAEISLIDKISSNIIKIQASFKPVFDSLGDEKEKRIIGEKVKENAFKILEENHVLLEKVFLNIKTVFYIKN